MTVSNFFFRKFFNLNFPGRPTTIFNVIALFFTLCLISKMGTTWAQASKVDVPSFDILVTDDLKNKGVVQSFSCSSRVYLYFTWYLLEDMHEVTAFWINPQGKEENQIRLKFIAKKPKTTNWVALEFKNIFDNKIPIAPSLKASRMSGKWKARVLLDGNPLETRQFDVHCG